MMNKPTLAIIITPFPRSELRSIFSDQPNSIRRELENPPQLRPRGWGIRTGDTAHLIDGEYLRTEGDREAINLYRDGEFVVAIRIDRNSLAWADKTDSRIHPLAFVEFITNTLTFYSLVLADMRIPPQSLQLRIQLDNLMKDNGGIQLPAGTLNNVGWTHGNKPASAASWSREVRVEASNYNPTRVAFLLLREVYAWFGHLEEDIPYITGSGDEKAVDISAIEAIG